MASSTATLATASQILGGTPVDHADFRQYGRCMGEKMMTNEFDTDAWEWNQNSSEQSKARVVRPRPTILLRSSKMLPSGQVERSAITSDGWLFISNPELDSGAWRPTRRATDQERSEIDRLRRIVDPGEHD